MQKFDKRTNFSKIFSNRFLETFSLITIVSNKKKKRLKIGIIFFVKEKESSLTERRVINSPDKFDFHFFAYIQSRGNENFSIFNVEQM